MTIQPNISRIPERPLRRLQSLLFKRIWLPRPVYEALPVMYIVCGLIALGSALHLPGRSWMLPWGIVLGLAAIHFGLGIFALRQRLRKRGKAKPAG